MFSDEIWAFSRKKNKDQEQNSPGQLGHLCKLNTFVQFFCLITLPFIQTHNFYKVTMNCVKRFLDYTSLSHKSLRIISFVHCKFLQFS